MEKCRKDSAQHTFHKKYGSSGKVLMRTLECSKEDAEHMFKEFWYRYNKLVIKQKGD